MKITKCSVSYYEVDVPEKLKDFLNWEFSSGGRTGEDFKRFARLFRNYIKKNLPKNAKVVNCNVNHYCLSGFIERNGKYVYFSISDVRFWKNEWFTAILIRTAKHDKDYTGGSNCETTLPKFKENVEKLLNHKNYKWITVSVCSDPYDAQNSAQDINEVEPDTAKVEENEINGYNVLQKIEVA